MSLEAEAIYDDEIDDDKYLTFVVGSETYGLHIRYVREIIGMQAITLLPDVPEWIRGVINLRGKVIPVMDIRKRFRLGHREDDRRTCIVVVNVSAGSVGLVVDRVSEVIDIAAENIEPPPHVDGGTSQHFLSGLGKVGDEVRLLLDAPKLLAPPQIAATH